MVNDISEYFKEPELIDELSVTELEALCKSFPFDQALHILLVRKLAGYNHLIPQSTLNIVDRSMVSPEYLRLQRLSNPVDQADIESIDYELKEQNTSSKHPENPDNFIPEPVQVNDKLSAMNDVSESVTLSNDNIAEFRITQDEENIHFPKVISELNSMDDSNNANTPMHNVKDASEDVIIVSDELTVSDVVVPDHPESVLSFNSADARSPEINVLGDFSEKKKRKKKKNKKTDKFRLTDYTGVSEYTLWLKRLSGDISEKNKIPKKAKHAEVLESVRKSVQKSDSIISEPLAQILASQGHISEALKMYHQLMVKYPEKSVFFAARIDELLKSKEE